MAACRRGVKGSRRNTWTDGILWAGAEIAFAVSSIGAWFGLDLACGNRSPFGRRRLTASRSDAHEHVAVPWMAAPANETSHRDSQYRQKNRLSASEPSSSQREPPSVGAGPGKVAGCSLLVRPRYWLGFEYDAGRGRHG